MGLRPPLVKGAGPECAPVRGWPERALALLGFRRPPSAQHKAGNAFDRLLACV
jgi:hypothetical protein